MEPVLEPLGIGVAKLTVSPADPHVLDVSYYGGTQGGAVATVHRHAYLGRTEVQFPGDFGSKCGELDLAIVRSSPFSFTIAASRAGQPLAKGLGLTDPAAPGAIMVAWWTEATEPYGVVKYSIRDGRTIVGYYISKMTPSKPGEDIAIGDTSDGFCGAYLLNSQEVDGRTWGPHIWTLSSRGAVTDLAWEEHDRIFCRELGMPDPADGSSIIATYIAL